MVICPYCSVHPLSPPLSAWFGEGGGGEGEPNIIVLEGITGKEWVTFFRGFQSFYIKSNFDKNFNIMGVH